MLGSIGIPELLLILLIVIIIFGAGKLPQLGRGIGEGIRNFKHGLKGEEPTRNKNDKTDEGSKER